MPLDAKSLLDPEGVIAARLPGFEPRPQQIEMAVAVERALESRARLLVEAGTGTGKSFAYLVPAIARILAHRERVVVVTNTITLQEQLVDKDLPLLREAFAAPFTAVLVKGRNNYVSLRRLRQASARQDRLFSDSRAKAALHELEDWAYETDDGSLSSLPQVPPPSVWDHARSDAHNCMGRKCPSHDKCFYQSARRRMESGELLVCNHALFFSDLALRMQGVGFLPPYDHVILDEAHSVEEIAAEHFGLSLSESRVMHLLRLLYEPRKRRGFLAQLALADGSTSLIDRTIEQSMGCAEDAARLFDTLAEWQRRHRRSSGRIDEPDIVPNTITEGMTTLSKHLRLLKEKASSDADAFELNGYAVRAQDIATHADLLLGQRVEGCVYFVEGADAPARRRRVSIRCMTVDVAPTLREQLFDRELSVVLTSATLATGPGDFSHIAGRLGCADAPTLQLGSPFDYPRQMRVVVDQNMPLPTDARYVDRLVPRIEQLVEESSGGAFVLFTSFAMLRNVAERLRPALEDLGFPVLVHGDDGPRGQLLERFRGDGRSVLFGTTSFWQGVDVRGEGLRTVIITRLPFEVPDRPLVEARHDRIRERGENPFVVDQLPRAVIRFRQGVGRLIRSQSDRGTVAVLDPRIVTKPYGRLFLAALPEGVEIEPMDREEAIS